MRYVGNDKSTNKKVLIKVAVVAVVLTEVALVAKPLALAYGGGGEMRTQAPDLKTIKVKEPLELIGMDLIGEHQFGYHSFFLH